MGDRGEVERPHRRALTPGPLLLAWLAAIAVDLFFNAGVLSWLFDQAREPGLLADDVLFRRIPIAYLAVGCGVVALAWLLDRADMAGIGIGVGVGSTMGLLLGVTGVVWLWTAIEMTGLFVVGGVVVQISQLGAAGAVLGSVTGGTDRRRIRRWSLLGVVLAVVAAIVAQNLLR